MEQTSPGKGLIRSRGGRKQRKVIAALNLLQAAARNGDASEMSK
jgi:hypothetical protein